jgi:uncharacterized phage-associated protein
VDGGDEREEHGMLVSAHDVARELRRRVPGVGVTNVHKMLYYGQGWSLALNGEPLFGEGLEAWTNGPVVATLWHDEKHNREIPPALVLDEQQMAIVEKVVERYGHLSAAELSEMTHQEAPWRNAMASEDPNPPIRRRALLAHFATVRGMDHAEGGADAELDERLSVLQRSLVKDFDVLPVDYQAQVEEDARKLSARLANRAS